MCCISNGAQLEIWGWPNVCSSVYIIRMDGLLFTLMADKFSCSAPRRDVMSSLFFSSSLFFLVFRLSCFLSPPVLLLFASSSRTVSKLFLKKDTRLFFCSFFFKFCFCFQRLHAFCRLIRQPERHRHSSASSLQGRIFCLIDLLSRFIFLHCTQPITINLKC